MLNKSSKWELGFIHYIAKFTILRFVISRFDCTITILVRYSSSFVLRCSVLWFSKLRTSAEAQLSGLQLAFGLSYADTYTSEVLRRTFIIKKAAFKLDVCYVYYYSGKSFLKQ